ncbi:MAG TPA: TadE/TadG family type IV pilus assembly protein [Intrasporangium sp.]|uniref:TadE/TadG family type IV pilus assembly protein n=1 Tax=Intrasporangium sp. TaxID=1925024 RepID=UPI002D78589D|nr:TadE/TadG family type IV pilus assembly protein [Intrasporangium sp.]HET7398031.1 TadE/TadG family type IV pilus assembly protein [Intrasporangium sp.]
MRASHGRRRERGASAVEFALMLPFLMLVLAGIVDFGRAFFVEIQLANAAREGARAAIISPTNNADIQARATRAAQQVPSLSFPTIVACPNASNEATVKAQSQIQWVFMAPAMRFFGGPSWTTKTLSSTAVMKCGG